MKKIVRRFAAISLCVFFILNGGMSVHAAGNKAPDYKIYVNRAANCVTVVTKNASGKETPVRAMACSCGRERHETPLGVFKTSQYYEWRMLVDGAYGRYAVRFNGPILFHSVPYLEQSPDTLEWDQYNLLGEGASLGCVRLRVTDVKWIYENCKPGTTVVVYDDEKNPGPLGKPETIDIEENSACKGWDPTDMDIHNPWHTILSGVTFDNFDAEDYAGRYPDVRTALGTDKERLWSHYMKSGRREGRVANAVLEEPSYENFDAEMYAALNPDVTLALGTDKDVLWKHYTSFGVKEGREGAFAVSTQTETFENFNAELYAERYPDIKALFGSNKELLWTHYIEIGKQEGKTVY